MTIRFEEGLEEAANGMLSLVPRLKEVLEERTGLPFEHSFTLLLVRRRAEFIRAVGSDLVSAIAVPDRMMIVMDLSRMSVHPLNIENILIHEMCHLLLHEHLEDSVLPKWFDEGVSQWVSGGVNELIDPDPRKTLKKAVLSNSLLSFDEIRSSFPPDKERFALSYEQSLSMVSYIEERFGKGAIPAILRLLKQGMPFNRAIREATGISFGELVSSWSGRIRMRFTWFSYISDNIHWILFILAGVLTLLGYLRFRRRLSTYRDEEEEEPPPPYLE